MTTAEDALLLALIIRIPPEGVAVFQAYEDQVLPLLGAYGGTLQRRLRGTGGTIEHHIVRFESRAGYERFRDDPRRIAANPLMVSSGAVVELLAVHDVD